MPVPLLAADQIARFWQIAQAETVPIDENIFIGLSALPKESAYVS